MDDTIKKLRGLLVALDEGSRAVHESSSSGKIETPEAVAVGSALAALVKKANKALEPIKEHLRKEALSESSGNPGPYHFQSSDGAHCVVVVPKQRVSLRKDADMSLVKTALGGRFPQYFDEKVVYTPCKGFNKVALSSVDDSKIVMGVVDLNEGTPRVSFRD